MRSARREDGSGSDAPSPRVTERPDDENAPKDVPFCVASQRTSEPWRHELLHPARQGWLIEVWLGWPLSPVMGAL